MRWKFNSLRASASPVGRFIPVVSTFLRSARILFTLVVTSETVTLSLPTDASIADDPHAVSVMASAPAPIRAIIFFMDLLY